MIKSVALEKTNALSIKKLGIDPARIEKAAAKELAQMIAGRSKDISNVYELAQEHSVPRTLIWEARKRKTGNRLVCRRQKDGKHTVVLCRRSEFERWFDEKFPEESLE